MAEAANATSAPDAKDCAQCGRKFNRAARAGQKRWEATRFCSTVCANHSRADHTTDTLMKRLWAKVDKTPGYGPNGDCWEWQARVDGRGYGEIKVAGHYRKAHRIVLFGRDGLSNPLFACHRCDNPKCVNPSHLFPGEAVDNVRDMIAKGRSVHTIGGSGRSARKLTDADVRNIRASTEQQQTLAKRFMVDPMVIHRVRKRVTYRHVA